MGKAIVVTSGKGGVGKTTSSANIGVALALMGKKVCLVDLDIGLRNLDVILGLENRIMYDIVDVVKKKVTVQQALVKDKRLNGNLYLLPAAQNTDKDALNEEQVKTIVNGLEQEFDYVILDCPAGIEQGFMNAISGAQGAIVVVTPDISSVRDADRVIGLLSQHPLKDAPKLLINRVRPELFDDGNKMDIDEITRHLGIDLLGVIVDDEAVITTSNRGEPIVLTPDDKASKGYQNIARRIEGQTVPLMSFDVDEKPDFWHKLGNLFSHHK